MTVKHLQGLITDVDGTLIDSERGKMRSHQVTVEHFGGTWHDRLYLQFLGQSGPQVSAGIVRAAKLNCSPSDYREAYLAAKQTYGRVRPIHAWVPGMLCALYVRERLPIAFVSTGYDTVDLVTLVECLLDESNISPLGRLVICGRDDERIPEGRKTAAGIEQIVQALGATPGACLGLEDSHDGLQVLAAAGIGKIAVVQHFANRELPLPSDWLPARDRHVITATSSWREVRETLGI